MRVKLLTALLGGFCFVGFASATPVSLRRRACHCWLTVVIGSAGRLVCPRAVVRANFPTWCIHSHRAPTDVTATEIRSSEHEKRKTADRSGDRMKTFY